MQSIATNDKAVALVIGHAARRLVAPGGEADSLALLDLTQQDVGPGMGVIGEVDLVMAVIGDEIELAIGIDAVIIIGLRSARR